MTVWSGRVGVSLDPAVWEFLRANDAELLPYDCTATAEHAGRLHGAGLLTADEAKQYDIAKILAGSDGWQPPFLGTP